MIKPIPKLPKTIPQAKHMGTGSNLIVRAAWTGSPFLCFRDCFKLFWDIIKPVSIVFSDFLHFLIKFGLKPFVMILAPWPLGGHAGHELDMIAVSFTLFSIRGCRLVTGKGYSSVVDRSTRSCQPHYNSTYRKFVGICRLCPGTPRFTQVYLGIPGYIKAYPGVLQV